MIGVYVGSFDPFTNGHFEIVKRAKKLCNTLIILVAKNIAKNSLFTIEERIEIIKKSCENENISIQVESFDGLLVNYLENLEKEFKQQIIVIKGLRNTADFCYEKQMYDLNKKIYKNFETLFLMSDSNNSSINSTMIKELNHFGANLENLVPKPVLDKLKEKGKKDEKRK